MKQQTKRYGTPQKHKDGILNQPEDEVKQKEEPGPHTSIAGANTEWCWREQDGRSAWRLGDMFEQAVGHVKGGDRSVGRLS